MDTDPLGNDMPLNEYNFAFEFFLSVHSSLHHHEHSTR